MTLLVVCVILSNGCDRAARPRSEVVIYTSVDQPIADPILKDFERQSGIHVIVQTDAEATKSVGFAERLRAEKANPACDVWWSNEIFHTINLADEGVLAAYESPAAKDVPAQFKDAQHRWAGNGLRARVIAAATSASAPPTHLEQFASDDFHGQIAMARPTAGTTGGHVAALYVLWGDEKASQFFKDLRKHQVKLLGGNSVVAQTIGNGTIWFGLTDNDDVTAARDNGRKLQMILPDQDGAGTLLIPSTVALVTGAKHPDAAKKLIDFLLSAEVEKRLLAVRFAGWSVRESPLKIKAMQVDYRAVAQAMPRAVRESTAILEGRE